MIRRSAMALALLFLITSFGSGCMGRMAVTGAVTKFNLNATQEQWGREILFVGMYIIPVYPTCAFVDLFIVNAIEFWEGTNPLNGEPAITLSSAEGSPQKADSDEAAITTPVSQADDLVVKRE